MKNTRKYTIKSRNVLGALLLIGQLITAPLYAKQSEYQQPIPSQQHVEVLKPKNDTREYRSITLSNNIRTMLVSDPKLENFSVNLRLAEGRLGDPSDQRGFAHLYEHMIYGGSVRYTVFEYFSEHAKNIRTIDVNDKERSVGKAFANSTELGFYVTTNKTDKALVVFNQYLQAEFTSKEIKRGIRALNRHRVDKQAEMGKMLFADASPLHPIRYFEGNPVNHVARSDSREDIKALRKQLLAHHKAKFSANNMTLVVVGPNSLDKLAEYVEHYFSFIPSFPVEHKNITVEAYPKESLPHTLYIEPKDYLQNLSNRLTVQFFIPNNLKDWQTNPNEYVSWLLTNNDSSSLKRKLVDLNYISSINVDSSPKQFGSSGYLNVGVALTQTGELNRQKIIDLIYQYTSQLKGKVLVKDNYLKYIADANKNFEQTEVLDGKKLASKLSENLFTYPGQYALKGEYTALRFDASAIQTVLNSLKVDNSRVIQFKQQPDMTIDPSLPFKYKVVNK
ncbi:insulinase family protein [Algibacillus agarilyticus]|uniref:insulinase family protein n=1 Tax=Algibacillus agarilyticus TaxID=2234133 RepID=UPI00130077E0|nr:insulinase family protein [Algibacillus agarilyticus]